MVDLAIGLGIPILEMILREFYEHRSRNVSKQMFRIYSPRP